MGVLFQKRILDKYIEENNPNKPDESSLKGIIKKWKNIFEGKIKLNESQLEQSLNEDFFINILGYKRPPLEEFSFLPKKNAKVGRYIPDFIIGDFYIQNGKFVKDVRRIIGELKSPNINLDRIDPQRNKTPVEQGFEYGKYNGLYVNWIIVSNMRTIRLYKNTSISDYEEFKILNFLNDTELTNEFWKFYFLLHNDYLLKNAPNTRVSKLISDNIEERIKLTENFYQYYRQIWMDTYDALSKIHKNIVNKKEGRVKISNSAQKLLLRGLLICFMSDHPQKLLPNKILNYLFEQANNFPSLRKNKIYPLLTDLFTCLENGNPLYYPINIFGYDGDLFKFDSIIDSIILPDSLFNKKYNVGDKTLKGIYGFKDIDFYYELSPHILGRLFESSLNDQEELIKQVMTYDNNILETFSLQKKLGVVYTREVLTTFAAESVLSETFFEIRKNIMSHLFSDKNLGDLNREEEGTFWKYYLDELLKIKIIDIAVGSGAFLVSCYNVLKREISNAFEMQKIHLQGLERYLDAWETSLLDNCLYGKDIMPDAISIAKISLWLASIRKNIKLHEFSDNFVVSDSLDKPVNLKKIDEKVGNYEQYNIVIGNPPWGSEINESAIQFLNIEFPEVNIDGKDSFELFILVALKYLKIHGRLCLILPHTLLFPEKEKTREFLFSNYKIEKWHYLGAEWFSSDIRMDTTLLQLKKEKPLKNSKFISMILVDQDRKKAIKGELDLSQLEKSIAFSIPQERSNIRGTPVELFRYVEDDEIINLIETYSQNLSVITESGRGVELNKEGLIIQCPSCGKWLPPPSAKRNIPSEQWDKICSFCKHEFLWRDALATNKIVSDDPSEFDVPYLDGESYIERYSPPKYRSIKLGIDGINYHSSKLYAGEKILIRKTGVGLSVIYDNRNAYCPQTMYIFKMSEEYKHINAKFVFAVLSSRVLAYYVFKKYGAVDAAQAFAQLTLNKLRGLPIPVKKSSDPFWKKIHDEIILLVDKMLAGEQLGGAIDWEIERLIQTLFKLEKSHTVYINQQFGLVAYHKYMKELFPQGPPPKPVRLERIEFTLS